MIRVVKIGGNVVDNPEMLAAFVRDFAAMPGAKVLVHGGGVLASRIQKALGQTPVMIQGRRVTDEETLKTVTMVYAGWCNKNITALLQAQGCNAIGLSGADGNAICASKRPPVDIDGEQVDFGFVGDVRPEGVNAEFLRSLLDAGIVPVLCAINHDGKGNLLNTNADTVASSVAVALCGTGSASAQESPVPGGSASPDSGTASGRGSKASGCDYSASGSAPGEDVELIYCFEKDGVLRDRDDDSSVIPHISESEFVQLKEQGIIADGMIPKLQNAFKAIRSGVRKVSIKHPANLLSDKGTTLE